jgi:hypothetical protein
MERVLMCAVEWGKRRMLMAKEMRVQVTRLE